MEISATVISACSLRQMRPIAFSMLHDARPSCIDLGRGCNCRLRGVTSSGFEAAMSAFGIWYWNDWLDSSNTKYTRGLVDWVVHCSSGDVHSYANGNRSIATRKLLIVLYDKDVSRGLSSQRWSNRGE